MKDRIKTVVDDGFSVLLFGLPQGLPLGVIWLAYIAWATFNMRSSVSVHSFSPLK